VCYTPFLQLQSSNGQNIFSYENQVFYVTVFNFSKISSKNNSNIFNVCISLLKIKNDDLENSKHLKFWHSTRLSHEEFNEHDKSKFGDDIIYF
jgi:hypothetical protein